MNNNFKHAKNGDRAISSTPTQYTQIRNNKYQLQVDMYGTREMSAHFFYHEIQQSMQ